MRRKSERNKSKSSPDRKIEKLKRDRVSKKRRKSDSSSPDRVSVPEEAEPDVNNKIPSDNGNDDMHPKEISEADEDPIWTVKTAGTSSDSGEIQKLTICLSRPPSISDHSDKSPRAKKKLDRSSSQTDSPSESPDDTKKKRHKSKRNSVKEEETKQGGLQQSVEVTEEPVTSSQEIYDTNIADIVRVPLPDQPPPENQSEYVLRHQINIEEDNKEKSSTDESNSNKLLTDQQQEQAPDMQIKQDAIVDKSPDSESVSNAVNASPNDGDISVSQDPYIENCNDNGISVSSINNIDKNESTDENQITAADSTSKNDQCKITETPECINHVQDGSHTPEQERSLTPELKDKPPVTRQISESSNVAQKKRRWGKTSKVTKVPIVNISTDSLKNLISDVQPVGLDDCLLEDTSKKTSTKEKKHSKEKKEPELKKIEKISRKVEEKVNNELINNMSHRKISITSNKETFITQRPPSPPKYMSSSVLFITNLVRPFTLPQLRNLLQRTGKIMENGFWIDKIKSKCYVEYENEDQAVETRHALHGVTWPVSNPKTLNVDFSSKEALQTAMSSENVTAVTKTNNTGSIEAWVKDQNVNPNNIVVLKDELDKPWDKRRTIVREWDLGKGEIIDDKFEKDKEKHDRIIDRRKRRSAERSPEPAKKFKKKEDEAPAKLLDDLFRKTKTTPCIYWLPLTVEMIKVKEEQRRLHMAEHERRMAELRRSRQTHQHSTHHRR